jgi:hypothetical protein
MSFFFTTIDRGELSWEFYLTIPPAPLTPLLFFSYYSPVGIIVSLQSRALSDPSVSCPRLTPLLSPPFYFFLTIAPLE